jgi:hypothetical protein
MLASAHRRVKEPLAKTKVYNANLQAEPKSANATHACPGGLDVGSQGDRNMMFKELRDAPVWMRAF